MAEKKPKMELQLNQTATLELLADPYVGQSTYGEYVLLNVKRPNGDEFTLFAPGELLEEFKALRKGAKVEITKQAEQQGKKIVTKYDFKVISNGNGNSSIKKNQEGEGVIINRDYYFDIMLSSYEDSLKIQEKLNGMVDVNKIAICLFIARSKVNGNGIGA